MAYAANTIATFVWCVLTCISAQANLVYCAYSVYVYRRDVHRQTGGSSAGHPMLLRVMWLGSNICSALCAASASYQPLLYVDDRVNVNPWSGSALSDLGGTTSMTQLCAASVKFDSIMYAMSKFFSYLFFFLKQRTVRPMSKMMMLEKVVLGATFGVVAFAVIIGVVIEGERNGLDGTCQLFVPVYILIIMCIVRAAADGWRASMQPPSARISDSRSCSLLLCSALPWSVIGLLPSASGRHAHLLPLPLPVHRAAA